MELQFFTQRTAESTCGSPASQVSIEVDGQPAILSTFAACNGLSAEKTFNLWVTAYGGGTQWWQIVWLDVPGNEAGDTVFFAQALATFRFGDIPPAP